MSIASVPFSIVVITRFVIKIVVFCMHIFELENLIYFSFVLDLII